MKTLFISLLVILGLSAFAQQKELPIKHTEKISELEAPKDLENIHVHKLCTDDHATSFVIWVKQAVKSHKHENHSETLYVLEGKGEMTVGDHTFEIEKGDFFNIPKGTYHSVVVTSKKPMKVISVQAPEFIGKDRIFEDK